MHGKPSDEEDLNTTGSRWLFSPALRDLKLLQSMTPNFTVAIVGGGVAGVTLAIALCRLNPKKDIKIDIYEGAHAFTEIGAGVALWKRPWNVMKKLGLEEDLSRVTNNILDEPRK